MRKKRKPLATFILAIHVALLPLFLLWASTEIYKAEAENSVETYQVKLDEKSNTVAFVNKSNSIVELTLDFETESRTASIITTDEFDSTSELISNDESASSDEQSSIDIEAEFSSIPTDSSGENSKQQVDSSPSESTETRYIDGLEEFEYFCLAIISTKETGSASPAVQKAVISAILNRVKCHAFPNTVYEVIMQKGQFYDDWPSIPDKNGVICEIAEDSDGWPCFVDEDGMYHKVTLDDIPMSIQESIHAVITEGDFSNGAYFFISPQYLPQSTVNRFHELYGEPCFTVEGGEFFTLDYGEG